MTAPMPAQVVTRDQVLDLLAPFVRSPEHATQVVCDVEYVTVIRRRPNHESLMAPLLAALGLDPHRVTRVVFDPDRITVTEYLVDSLGRTYLDVDEQPATATTTIGIQ